MTVWQRIYRGETRIDFVGLRRRGFALSAVLLVISLGGLLIRGGFNLGVDFSGGTVVEASNAAGVTVDEVRDAIRPLGLASGQVQLTGGDSGVRVQTEALDADTEQQLVEAVARVAGVAVSETSVEAVGPTFGDQVTRAAVRALIIFLVVVALFITWRFEWKMAGAALVAVVHDLLLTAGVYAVFGFEVTPSTVIAVLTILGYSLYDTVVVFDKLQENVLSMGDKQTFDEIINSSMNTVLMRSLNTSLTTLLPIGSLLFVGSFLLGATTLRDFALALFVGVAAGTYSSIFVAAPLLAIWKGGEEHWRLMERKTARPRIEPAGPAPAVEAPARRAQPAAAPTAPTATATRPAAPRPAAPKSRPAGQTTAPRPPKKRKKRR